MFTIPQIGEKLSQEDISFLKVFAKSVRHTSISMLKNAQSGHPGGSLGSADFLTLIYTCIVSQTGEKVVISNGHISPAVYSVLAELGYISKQEVIEGFRKIGKIYEGHITRHVPGVWYGTGPLGIGTSVASAFALAEKLKNSNQKVFLELGDGEAQEGQVYEMMHFAKKYKLDNLIAFVDYNKVQLTDSLENIMPIDLKAIFESAHWEVMEVDGHNFEAMWDAISKAYEVKEKPIVLIGHTIMGKGVDFMEEEGKAHRATWHGNAPKSDQADEALKQLELSEEEKTRIENFLPMIQWKPAHPSFQKLLEKVEVDVGEPIVYGASESIDCRTAYGKTLLDLAKKNKHIVAATADLMGSVMTKFVAQEIPERHFECGIAEQHMVSLGGGLSLVGFIPFVSTFGAFLTSRAKDQARVNDINRTNVKMVATHCGLSVGEDGPTHQAIDDKGAFLGHLNTMIIEPADPNQTDRIIRYIASHYGNFYVRMGRHKFPILTKEDGSIFYGPDYVYKYGKTDTIREGSDITIAASGAMIHEALLAREALQKENPNVSVEIVAVSGVKHFDENLMRSIQKTKRVITIEDHNLYSGFGAQLAKQFVENGIKIAALKIMGVEQYQLSGKAEQLYEAAGISASHIKKACLEIVE